MTEKVEKKLETLYERLKEIDSDLENLNNLALELKAIDSTLSKLEI